MSSQNYTFNPLKEVKSIGDNIGKNIDQQLLDGISKIFFTALNCESLFVWLFSRIWNRDHQALDIGDTHALNFLAKCYRYCIGTKIDTEKKFHWAKESAALNFALGQYNLGFCYLHGISTEKNLEKASEWFKKAIHIHLMAQYSVGFCYRHGKGTKVDQIKAVHWYRLAANNRHGMGQ
ncbi:hypothetical protein G9A89_021725 [Geosiphon pyriformis]|nr:hypothetical protein G9A89_021725 [Geosiphon pyriformis]